VAHSSYNDVLYDTRVHFDLHPDRMCAVGRLFGMNPAPVDACRYLEIGCGTALNLLSTAYWLPESRFLGVDLAEVPIAAGEQIRVEAGIGNLTLRAADLREIGADWGEFDYISAHGVYSWVPPEVRDHLLRICHERLAPHGIAFISFNTLPGRHARQYLRNYMLQHTRGMEDPAERVAKARWSLRSLISQPRLPDHWRPLLEKEVAAMLAMSDGWFFHDDLSDCNDPMYFREFASHAARHGLQYLGDADPAEMFDPHGLLKEFNGDRVEREQEMDYFKARMFRQALLCRSELTLREPEIERAVDQFLFSSLTRMGDDGHIEGMRKVKITPRHAAVRNVAAALGEVYPLPLSFEELLPYAGDEQALRMTLSGMVLGGFADFHVYGFPCQEEVTDRPSASRLARLLARQSGMVANACGRSVDLDPVGRSLIQLLDGSRDHGQIAEDLAKTPGAPPADEIAAHLPASLEWMAHAALLEG
jgi:SAM-dependent methyltransferase